MPRQQMNMPHATYSGLDWPYTPQQRRKRSRSLPAAGEVTDRQTLLCPEKALAELNRRFQTGQHSEHYFTVWFGVYEAPTRTLRYVGAGCPPALALNAGDGGSPDAVTVTELPAESMPVGMFDDATFMSSVYSVPHGCRILVHSDGASEIIVAGGQLSQRDFEDLAAKLAVPDGLTLDGFVDTLRDMTPDGAFEDDCSLIELTFD
jgi:sigma-B regulation protein RsbU (phosphoserine phosphatase)